MRCRLRDLFPSDFESLYYLQGCGPNGQNFPGIWEEVQGESTRFQDYTLKDEEDDLDDSGYFPKIIKFRTSTTSFTEYKEVEETLDVLLEPKSTTYSVVDNFLVMVPDAESEGGPFVSFFIRSIVILFFHF